MIRALARNPIRTGALWALERVAPERIVIRHHWTGDPMMLHTFRHKGYWYHGRRRERSVMEAMSRLVGAGQRVFDVGGHVGYTALWFSRCAGPTGEVLVFEPGPNNLPYLRVNTINRPNVRVLEVGAGPEPGSATLHCEDLTGQNNSFVGGYQPLSENEGLAHRAASVQEVTVPVTTLDLVASEAGAPDFVKVDVEGYELEVLQGASGLLSSERPPALMVELTRREGEVAERMAEHGYVAFAPEGQRLEIREGRRGNVFFLHAERHRELAHRAGFQP